MSFEEASAGIQWPVATISVKNVKPNFGDLALDHAIFLGEHPHAVETGFFHRNSAVDFTLALTLTNPPFPR